MSFTSGAQWVCSFHYSFFFFFQHTFHSSFSLSLSLPLSHSSSLSLSLNVWLLFLCARCSFRTYVVLSQIFISFLFFFHVFPVTRRSFHCLFIVSLATCRFYKHQPIHSSCFSRLCPRFLRPLFARSRTIYQSVFPVFLVDYSPASSDHPKTVRSTNLSRTIEIEWTAYARNSPTSISMI